MYNKLRQQESHFKMVLNEKDDEIIRLVVESTKIRVNIFYTYVCMYVCICMFVYMHIYTCVCMYIGYSGCRLAVFCLFLYSLSLSLFLLAIYLL